MTPPEIDALLARLDATGGTMADVRDAAAAIRQLLFDLADNDQQIERAQDKIEALRGMREIAYSVVDRLRRYASHSLTCASGKQNWLTNEWPETSSVVNAGLPCDCGLAGALANADAARGKAGNVESRRSNYGGISD